MAKKIEEKILTKHPAGKAGVNISLQKYTLIKETILSIIDEHEKISYKDLNSECEDALVNKFEGSIQWYVVSVKLDLEARGIIVRSKGPSGHLLSLNQ